jgi:glutathione S-transferase
MVLKLVGHPISTCTKRVAVVLKETNTPFEFEVVDIFSEPYLTMTLPLRRFSSHRS